MKPPKTERDLQQLLARLCDEHATAEEITWLDSAVAKPGREQTLYLEFMAAEARLAVYTQQADRNAKSTCLIDLEQAFTEGQAEAADNVNPPETDRIALPTGKAIDWRYHPVRFLGTVAALTLLFVAVFLIWIGTQPREQGLGVQPLATSDGKPVVVARVVDSRDIVEQSGSSPVFPGAHLQQGQTIRLASGLVRVCLKDGTMVLVEGPAALTVEDVSTVTLEHGKLVARIDDAQPARFAVNTPLARIVDLGTEFGVEVASLDSTRLDVLEGSVRVEPAAETEASGLLAMRTVRAGEAFELSAQQGFVALGQGQRPRFVRSLPTMVAVGDPLQPRLKYDSSKGVLMLRQTAVEHTGTVESLNLFSEEAGRWITPLLLALDPSHGGYRISGIGRSVQTHDTGVQRHAWQPLVGSNRVEAGKHVWGFFTGAVEPVADGQEQAVIAQTSQGGVPYDAGQGHWTFCLVTEKEQATALPLGQVLAFSEDGQPVETSRPIWHLNNDRTQSNRRYSIQLEIRVRE